MFADAVFGSSEMNEPMVEPSVFTQAFMCLLVKRRSIPRLAEYCTWKMVQFQSEIGYYLTERFNTKFNNKENSYRKNNHRVLSSIQESREFIFIKDKFL